MFGEKINVLRHPSHDFIIVVVLFFYPPPLQITRMKLPNFTFQSPSYTNHSPCAHAHTNTWVLPDQTLAPSSSNANPTLPIQPPSSSKHSPLPYMKKTKKKSHICHQVPPNLSWALNWSQLSTTQIQHLIEVLCFAKLDKAQLVLPVLE